MGRPIDFSNEGRLILSELIGAAKINGFTYLIRTKACCLVRGCTRQQTMSLVYIVIYICWIGNYVRSNLQILCRLKYIWTCLNWTVVDSEVLIFNFTNGFLVTSTDDHYASGDECSLINRIKLVGSPAVENQLQTKGFFNYLACRIIVH